MFDLEKGVWTKPSSHTKEKKIQHLQLSDEAINLLVRMQENRQSETFLFPGLSGNEPRTTLKASWHWVCREAGLSGVRIHDLRHNFASYLVSGGASLHVVSGLLGHTQPQTTARYAHLAGTSMREASNIFGNVFRTARVPSGVAQSKCTLDE